MLSTAHRYFLEVARAGSIKDAAVRLHVAASAISRQIAKLEDANGALLFERRPHGMVLTRAGELLADHARRMSLDSERVLRDIRNLNRKGLTTIRIGSNEAVARNLLPDAIVAYRELHPDVAFQVQVASPVLIAQRLNDQIIDIGVAFNLKAGNGIDVKFETASPVRAIMAPSHPLATRPQVSLEELKAYPIALTDSGTTVRLLFDSWQGGEDGSPFDLAFSSNSSSMIRSIVERGHAITLAGEITLNLALEERSLVAIPISDAAFGTRTLQVQTSSDNPLSGTAKAFLPLLIAALGKASHVKALRDRNLTVP